MEHRHYPRVAQVYSVAICQKDQPVVMSETTDISKYGMFIQTKDLPCIIGNFFRIDLYSKRNSKQCVSVNALVVHRSERGVGVVLERALDIWPEIYDLYKTNEDAQRQASISKLGFAEPAQSLGKARRNVAQ